MSDEQVIQEAKEVAMRAEFDSYIQLHKQRCSYASPESVVRALHAAGLLASPEMRELCEAVNAHIAPASIDDVTRDCGFLDTWKRVRRAVRAYRAAKQPKPRFTVEHLAYESRVFDARGNGGWCASFSGDGRNSEAEGYAARRNALAAESPR